MKKRYVPSVKSIGAICETNYFRLYQLLGDDNERAQFSVLSPQGHAAEVELLVIESFKFTSTIQVSISHHGFPKNIGEQQLLLRCYDDLRMAEVVASGHGQQFAGVYPYPNEQMLQIDEKEQLNKYLAEWLSWIQAHGMSPKSRL